MTQKELRMVLVGKAGAGKSSTGNSLLGKNAFSIGHSFDTCTKINSVGVKEAGDGMSSSIKIVDTPGLTDCNEDPGHFGIKEIVSSLKLVTPGPHAILFVIPMNKRFTEEVYTTFSRLKYLFGNDITRYLVLVFTHGDIFKDSHVTFPEMLKKAPARVLRMLEDCTYRHVVFDNTSTDPKQVEDLFQVIAGMVNQPEYFSSFVTDLENGQLDKELEARIRQGREEERKDNAVMELQRLNSEIENTVKVLEHLKYQQQLAIQDLLEERDMEKRRSEAIQKVMSGHSAGAISRTSHNCCA